jgi:uncharacterized membrane protein
MTADKATMVFGGRVFGIGIMAIAALCLAWGAFASGQPVPKDFPDRTLLAYAAAVFMLVTAVAIEWRRTVAWGAAALTAYYAIVVIILMNGHVLLVHFVEYGTYETLAVQIAITSAGLMLYAANGKMDPARAARFTRLGQTAFGVCALIFGGAHFVYMNLTAPLVPRWLPPSQMFWGYVTGICHIAAGLAILTGVRARLAATLLTAMYASFTPLVHLPMLLANPSSHWIWSENAVNIALTGAAWVMADSLARSSHQWSDNGSLPRIGGHDG